MLQLQKGEEMKYRHIGYIIIALLAVFFGVKWSGLIAVSRDALSARKHQKIFGGDERMSSGMFQIQGVFLGIRNYYKTLGKYPCGDNHSVAMLLTGQNAKGIEFLTSKHDVKDGELLDSWGNAYEISVSEWGHIQIHSAGSNGIMGDSDDKIIDYGKEEEKKGKGDGV